MADPRKGGAFGPQKEHLFSQHVNAALPPLPLPLADPRQGGAFGAQKQRRPFLTAGRVDSQTQGRAWPRATARRSRRRALRLRINSARRQERSPLLLGPKSASLARVRQGQGQGRQGRVNML